MECMHMRPLSWVPRALTFVLLCSLFAVLAARAQMTGGSLPQTWLDSLEANSWRMEGMSKISGYRVKELSEELNSDGEVKESETKFYQATVSDSGKEERSECDSTGNLLPVEQKPKGQAKESVTISQEPPLKLFDKERQEKYDYKFAGGSGEGSCRIDFERKPGSNSGYSGFAVVDTASWTITRLSLTPHPFPDKRIREFNMDLQFEPDSRGYMLMKRLSTSARGKYLIFRFAMRTTQDYYDFR